MDNSINEQMGICLLKNVDLSLSERDITSLINISKNSQLLQSVKSNSLVLSVYDKYVLGLDNVYSYQENNIIFINDNKDIIPLSYSINNINSAFTIDKNKYTVKIDNNTIIEKDKILYGSYNHIPIAKNHIGGRSTYDDSTLTLNKNQLSFTNKIINKINVINDYLKSNEYNVKLNIYNSTLEKYRINNAKYLLPIYNIDNANNALTLNTNHITYKDKNEIIYDVDISHQVIKIDYGVDEFNLILRFRYNYISDRDIDYNYYTNLIHDIITNYVIISTNKISINESKSYIFDIHKTYFNLNDNSDIEITADFKYNANFKINYKNIGDKYLDFNIKILNNILNFILLLDTQDKLYKVGNIIYYDRYHGYNFDKHGNQLGICLYPQNYFVDNDETEISVTYNSNSYFYNINVDENNISDDVKKCQKPIYVKMTDNSIDTIDININENNANSINYHNINADKLICASFNVEQITEEDEENPENEIITYSYNLTYAITSFDSSKYYYNVPLSLIYHMYKYEGKNDVIVNRDFIIDSLFNYPKPKNNNHTYVFPYMNYSNAFNYINVNNGRLNSIYPLSFNSSLLINNINSNEKYYLPSLYDLEVFYGFGLQHFLKNNESVNLSSKIFVRNANSIYNYQIQPNNRIINSIINPNIIGGVDLKTILLFTIPDLNILYGDKYYILYDSEKKYDIIRTLTNESYIKLNMQRIGVSTTPNIYVKLQYSLKKNGVMTNYEYLYCSNNIITEYINTKAGKMILTNLSVTSFSISFNLYNHSTDESILTFYYKDSNDEMNDRTINENIEGNYKILCQLIVKK